MKKSCDDHETMVWTCRLCKLAYDRWNYRTKRARAVPVTVSIKTCRACSREQPAASFYRCYSTPDGLATNCRSCRVLETAAWQRKNPEKRRPTSQRYIVHLRMDVLQHYGGAPPSCACCGETTYEFLALDHIHGGGNRHRQQLTGSKKGGAFVYRWAKLNGFPPIFRVLCHNCNFASGHYGRCPHEAARGERLAEWGG